jgi:hypothetical protein
VHTVCHGCMDLWVHQKNWLYMYTCSQKMCRGSLYILTGSCTHTYMCVCEHCPSHSSTHHVTSEMRCWWG